MALYGATFYLRAWLIMCLQGSWSITTTKTPNYPRLSIGADFKGLLSIALYAFAIFVAFINPLIAKSIYVLVAIIWFAPDTLIERALSSKN